MEMKFKQKAIHPYTTYCTDGQHAIDELKATVNEVLISCIKQFPV
jgi:CheY-like chemotaxis protein